MSIIKFEDNVSIIVTLDYDEAKRVDGTYESFNLDENDLFKLVSSGSGRETTWT